MSDRKAILQIHREECLQCSSLVGFAVQDYPDCHYSRGNKQCPAQAVQVVLVFDQAGTVEALTAARAAGNWTAIATIMQTINNLPDFQKQSVLEAAALRDSHNSQPQNGTVHASSSRPSRPPQPVAGRSRN